MITSNCKNWKNKTSIKNTSHLITPKIPTDLEAIYNKDFIVKLFSYFCTLIKALINCTKNIH